LVRPCKSLAAASFIEQERLRLFVQGDRAGENTNNNYTCIVRMLLFVRRSITRRLSDERAIWVRLLIWCVTEKKPDNNIVRRTA